MTKLNYLRSIQIENDEAKDQDLEIYFHTCRLLKPDQLDQEIYSLNKFIEDKSLTKKDRKYYYDKLEVAEMCLADLTSSENEYSQVVEENCSVL